MDYMALFYLLLSEVLIHQAQSRYLITSTRSFSEGSEPFHVSLNDIENPNVAFYEFEYFLEPKANVSLRDEPVVETVPACFQQSGKNCEQCMLFSEYCHYHHKTKTCSYFPHKHDNREYECSERWFPTICSGYTIILLVSTLILSAAYVGLYIYIYCAVCMKPPKTSTQETSSVSSPTPDKGKLHGKLRERNKSISSPDLRYLRTNQYRDYGFNVRSLNPSDRAPTELATHPMTPNLKKTDLVANGSSPVSHTMPSSRTAGSSAQQESSAKSHDQPATTAAGSFPSSESSPTHGSEEKTANSEPMSSSSLPAEKVEKGEKTNKKHRRPSKGDCSVS